MKNLTKNDLVEYAIKLRNEIKVIQHSYQGNLIGLTKRNDSIKCHINSMVADLIDIVVKAESQPYDCLSPEDMAKIHESSIETNNPQQLKLDLK